MKDRRYEITAIQTTSGSWYYASMHPHSGLPLVEFEKEHLGYRMYIGQNDDPYDTYIYIPNSSIAAIEYREFE